jgi:hypothetical protein
VPGISYAFRKQVALFCISEWQKKKKKGCYGLTVKFSQISPNGTKSTRKKSRVNCDQNTSARVGGCPKSLLYFARVWLASEQLFFLLPSSSSHLLRAAPRRACIDRSARSNPTEISTRSCQHAAVPIPSRSRSPRISRRCDPRCPRAAGFHDGPADAPRSCAIRWVPSDSPRSPRSSSLSPCFLALRRLGFCRARSPAPAR